jgi:hypothetical protein
VAAITDGASGGVLSAASIVLERLDASDAGSLPAPAKVRFDNNDRFTIDDVAPGNYRMWVTGARRWQGVFKMYDGTAVQRRDIPPRMTLEPRSERGAGPRARAWTSRREAAPALALNVKAVPGR